MIRVILLLGLLGLTLPSLAATHWVTPTGAATWANCISATPLTGSAACSLATANANAAADDIVYFRGGNYSCSQSVGVGCIAPANSGTAGTPPHMINFWAWPADNPPPTFSGTGGFDGGPMIYDLRGHHYVSIRGMSVNLNGFWHHAGWIIGSHNEIAYNTFTSTTGGRILPFIGPGSAAEKASYGGIWATHNWLHHNVFDYSGAANGTTTGGGCTDGGTDTIRIGQPGSFKASMGDDGNTNNSIEYNNFHHAEHAHIDSYGEKTVVRYNTMNNEPWSAGCPSNPTLPSTYSSSNPNYTAYNGKYGHRNFQLTEDYNRLAMYDLIEGNRVGFASPNQGNDGVENFDMAVNQSIARYNFFFASLSNGVMFKYYFNSGVDNGGHGGTYNRYYNNTHYKNGWGYPIGLTTTVQNGPWPETALTTYVDGAGGSALGNVVKNNLFWSNTGYAQYQASALGRNVTVGGSGPAIWPFLTAAANNYCEGTQFGGNSACSNITGSDPLFTNPDITNPASTTLPDLSLQSLSPARDGAGSLTTAANSGANSTNLQVADAMYFQDGTWGSDIARASAGLGGTMQADWVCIGTVSNCVQIQSVTYGAYNAPAGTLTLATAATWANAAPVWLYKKSDGAVVLAGSAPDYGASEFIASSGSQISGTITGSVVNGVTLTLSGAASGTQTSDASGNYTFTGLSNGSYTITPTKATQTFSPLSRNVTVSGGNVGSVNFTILPLPPTGLGATVN